MEEKNEKITQLAQEVLGISRNSLIVNLRFMDKAISMLKFESMRGLGGIAVDGKNIYFDPAYVLKVFKNDKKLITRQYLHMVLHCVYSHFWISTLVNREYWNLACDIAVEYTINDMDIAALSTESVSVQTDLIDMLKKKVKYMTADMLYRLFLSGEIKEGNLKKLKKAFSADTHDIWYVPPKIEASQKRQVIKDNERDDGTGAEDKVLVMISYGKDELDVLRREWNEIARQMKMDLEFYSKCRGNMAGGLTQNLLSVTREKYDYGEFLKKFSVLGESMKINQDEFDYVFYTYGLKLYDNMPLIEPLEYKDTKQIREFVVAIDTSGSTSGELVQSFLQKTYNILKQEESFFKRFNLHIIQCDAAIQEDAKITSQSEFDAYIANMQIRGLGGTDFRPVFEYVDELVASKEFSNLKGLIYFTDGYGPFPIQQPPYNTAFVFMEDGYENPQVPVWAIKLVLQPEDIKEIDK